MHKSRNKFLDLMVLIEDQKWATSEYSEMIRNEKGQCPLCALIDALSHGSISCGVAARSAWLGFIGNYDSVELDDLERVVGAADWVNAPLRLELLEVLHVKE